MLAKKGWRPFGGLFGSGKAEEVSPEISVLDERGRYAPLDLEINGQKANRPSIWAQPGGRAARIGIQRARAQTGSRQSGHPGPADVKLDSNFSAILATGGEGTRELGTSPFSAMGCSTRSTPQFGCPRSARVATSTAVQPMADRAEIEDSKAFKELLKSSRSNP